MKILVLTDSPVWQMEKDGAFEYRHNIFLDRLKKLGHQISYIFLDRDVKDNPVDLVKMHSLGINSIKIFLPPKSKIELALRMLRDLALPRRKFSYDAELNQLIEENNPDLILMLNSIHPESTRNVSSEYPTILFAEEDFARSWNSAVTHSKGRKLFDRLTEKIVARTLPNPKVTVVISEAQRKWGEKTYPKSQICVLPLFLDDSYWMANFAELESTIDIFAIGDFNYSRNAWGMTAFLQQLSKLPSDERPSVFLASRKPIHAMLRDFKEMPLHLLGNVDDPRPLYKSAKICLVPAFHVSGAKNQILQAWAVGSAVLATQQSGDSVQATHRFDALLGGDVTEMANLAVEAIRDPELRSELKRNGKATFQEKFAREKTIGNFIKLCETVARSQLE